MKLNKNRKYKVYNEEGKLVANDIDTTLELLELNGYTIKEEDEQE